MGKPNQQYSKEFTKYDQLAAFWENKNGNLKTYIKDRSLKEIQDIAAKLKVGDLLLLRYHKGDKKDEAWPDAYLELIPSEKLAEFNSAREVPSAAKESESL